MPNELSSLRSACAISRLATRPCNFVVAEPGTEADIVVLAGPAGAKAGAALVTPSTRGVLWIGEEAPLARAVSRHLLQRPLLASRLLSALDRLAETFASRSAAAAVAPVSSAAAPLSQAGPGTTLGTTSATSSATTSGNAPGASPQAAPGATPEGTSGIHPKAAADPLNANSAPPAPRVAPAAPVARPRAVPPRRAFQPSVLVVDDSPTVRKQLELVLAGLEARVHVAGTGEEALELMAHKRFDLVLLDVVLPGSDGYSVCRSIKRDPKARLTPVVMLTSKSSPFDKIRGSMAGCDNYLTKPVTQDDFSRTVRRYLQAPADLRKPAANLHPA